MVIPYRRPHVINISIGKMKCILRLYMLERLKVLHLLASGKICSQTPRDGETGAHLSTCITDHTDVMLLPICEGQSGGRQITVRQLFILDVENAEVH